MTDENKPVKHVPNTPQTDNEPAEPLIPPQYLLVLGVFGLLVALAALLTQAQFGVVGFGGLGLGLLAFVAWALMVPQQAVAVLTGRTVRFGGVSVIVTLVFLTMLIVIYSFVRNQNIRFDLTERDQFSLTSESLGAITALGADPSIGNIKIIAFLGAGNAGARDQNTLLFESYVEASGGKVTYEFIDPDRFPNVATAFGISRIGEIVVVPEADPADIQADPVAAQFADQVRMSDGFNPDLENIELVTSSVQLQQDLTNAILKVAASGEFNAYFLTVQNNISQEMITIKQNLAERYDWVVSDISLAALTSPNGEFTLNNANLDGEVIVIPGGSTPLSAQEIEILQNYLNNGGNLVVLAGTNLNAGAISLATDPAFNEMLFNNFGLRINNDIVIDETQAFQSPILPVSIDFDFSHYITNNGIDLTQAVSVFEAPNSITIADTPPANVITTPLMRSSAEAYSRSDIAALLTQDAIERPADAVSQAYVLAASAENTQTGARVVLLGSSAIARDTYAALNIDNLAIAFNSLIWATDYNSFFNQITVLQEQNPTDTPIFADQQTLRNISFLIVIAIPFGVLSLGAYVWWSNRERRKA